MFPDQRQPQTLDRRNPKQRQPRNPRDTQTPNYRSELPLSTKEAERETLETAEGEDEP